MNEGATISGVGECTVKCYCVHEIESTHMKSIPVICPVDISIAVLSARHHDRFASAVCALR